MTLSVGYASGQLHHTRRCRLLNFRRRRSIVTHRQMDLAGYSHRRRHTLRPYDPSRI